MKNQVVHFMSVPCSGFAGVHGLPASLREISSRNTSGMGPGDTKIDIIAATPSGKFFRLLFTNID